MIAKALTGILGTALVLGSGLIGINSASAVAPSCASITKDVVVADGYTSATPPVATKYNYKKPSANAANALGTTLDFGPKALVVGCVSPAGIAKLSAAAQGKNKPAMTATQYLDYMVKQSAGAMKKTTVGSVADYVDFGNGKEDGLGSTATAGSVRLDTWVAADKYIILTFSQPAAATPPAALQSFIKTTTTLL